MSSRSRYLDTVLKLNRLSQNEEIEWVHHPNHVHEGLAAVDPAVEKYVAEWQGKRFVLYETASDETRSRKEKAVDALLVERRGFAHATLEIRNASGETLFTFPRMPAVNDLYETVYTGRSNEVDAFLDEFLSEE